MTETDSRSWLIRFGGALVVGAVILLVVGFLPPFRLVQRIQDGDYTALTAGTPLASHPDGIQIVAAPGDLDGSFRVHLSAVPQLRFLEGSVGDELRRAAQSLPANLVVKSPYYQIATRGQAPGSTLIAVDVPNNAEPWQTLDLYTWTGEGWQWVGGQVDAQRELILADVGGEIPQSVVVMQAGAVAPAVASELPLGRSITQAANSGTTHLLLVGLELGEAGTITGDAASLPVPAAGESIALMPTLRNWSVMEGEIKINQAGLADLLADPAARQAHLDHILALVIGQGYTGIDVDYAGVAPDWGEAFSDFVSDLAELLHSQGKVLSVAVQPPSPTEDGGWDTGGYDWRVLGQRADILRMPFPAADTLDREAYMAWALGQVSRYKLFPVVLSSNSDQVGDRIVVIDRQEAFAPLGSLEGPDGESVAPGDTVKVELASEGLETLQRGADEAYSYTYHDDAGAEHRVTLVTAASVAKTLTFIQGYHIGGVAIRGMLEPGQDPALPDVVRQFASQGVPVANSVLQVTWAVQAPDGQQLTQEDRPLEGRQTFEWTAPETEGDYTIKALLAPQPGTENAGYDSISVSVAAPESAATELSGTEPLTDTATVEPPETATPSEGETSSDCLNATYVADVTVPDNTRFEKAEAFAKTWRVRNSGSCAWPEGATLTFIDGDALEATKSVKVGALDAGGTKDISVDMTAPDADGSYRGVWRLVDDNGQQFGTRLTVVIQVGEEQVVAPPPSAPPPSGGGAFELGGHINTWNYVSQMQSAGMTWAKVQVHFGQDASGLVQAAHNSGFKIQLSALGTPGMVTQPNFHADYTAWVANLARAGADAIEVWNEPNIDREWQIGQINPAAYTQLLCASYSAIKAANANTAVISAAPAPTGYFGGCSGNGCDDLPWLQGMVNAGAANCMDYIGAHHNSGATSPSARSGHPADSGGGHHSWYFLPQTELYYNTFGGARKLFYTEMGYASQEGVPPFSDQFAWARGTNNAQQAAWLAEAVRLSRSTGMVRCIIVWNIDFARYGYDPQDGYAIIRPGGGCPACDSLRAAMQ
jgi:hypothetical protein